MITRLGVFVTLLMLTAGAEASADASAVVGTWHGSAEEIASPHIQGRAQITVSVMPDGAGRRSGVRPAASGGALAPGA